MEIENLLDQVLALNKKYEEIADVTGENFNVFKILKIESREVRLHSAFLVELLKPDGSHGQKDKFLKEFIRYFKIGDFEGLETINCQVVAEENNGKINEDYTLGGRMDIVIKSGSKVTVIENKVYASDQYNQLFRYKNRYKNATLFYLTLNGLSPSLHSIGYLKEDDYRCISYSIDIIKWLEKCREKSVMIPMLRECISAYINLLKHLTHQSPNKVQEMEIQKLLLFSEEKFKAAEIIASEIEKIRNNIFSCCKNELINSWIRKYETNEIEIFEFNNFAFYIKSSFESNYFHFDLFPKKKEDNSMGGANQKEFDSIRSLAEQFEERPKDYFYSNDKYTTWARSNFDLLNLKFENYRKLNEDRTEWLANILNEGEKFVAHIVNGLKEINNPNIKINMKFDN